MENLIWLSFIFLFVSAFFSMLGLGGGVLYVPILLFAGYTIKQAAAISLVLIIGTSIPAFINYFKHKKVDFKLAFIMEPASMIMAFLGGYFSSMVPPDTLKFIFSLVLFAVGVLMIKNFELNTKKVEDNKFWHLCREFNGHSYSMNIPLLIFISAIIGLLSGMIGISGAVMKLPAMVLLCGVPMDVAIATSSLMVGITAFSGLTGRFFTSEIDFITAFILIISVLIGSFIGSKISLKTNKVILKKMFGIFIFIVAIKFITEIL